MGSGIVDWKDFFAAAKVGGLKYIFVEMESNPAIMEGCARFLKSLGITKRGHNGLYSLSHGGIRS